MEPPFPHPLESKTHLYLRIYFASVSLVNTRQDPIIAADVSCFHEKWSHRLECQGCVHFKHLLIQSATNWVVSRSMLACFNEAFLWTQCSRLRNLSLCQWVIWGFCPFWGHFRINNMDRMTDMLFFLIYLLSHIYINPFLEGSYERPIY